MSTPVLEARGLNVNFSGVIAAEDVRLSIAEEERLAIIGPNGSGKTTFVNVCTGYIHPSSGQVLFRGRDITRLPPRAVTRLGIVRSFQIPQLFLEHTVLDNILIARAARTGIWNPLHRLHRPEAEAECRDMLRLLSVEDVAHSYIHELPEGQRKLVDIALAMILKPQVLFMDEPTSGVSSDEKFAIMDTLIRAIERQRVAAVFVEHDMEMVTRYADRVAVWSEGRILAEGPPREILDDPRVHKEVTGMTPDVAAS